MWEILATKKMFFDLLCLPILIIILFVFSLQQAAVDSSTHREAKYFANFCMREIHGELIAMWGSDLTARSLSGQRISCCKRLLHELALQVFRLHPEKHGSNLKTIRTQEVQPGFSFVSEYSKCRSLAGNFIKFKYSDGGATLYSSR